MVGTKRGSRRGEPDQFGEPDKKKKRTTDQANSDDTSSEKNRPDGTQMGLTNTSMPESLSYDPPEPSHYKIASWNVNSLMASLKKGFNTYVKAEDPTILCLQETKVNEAPAMLFPKSTYPYQYFSMPTNGKKGYSGTAILSKIKPLSVSYGIQNKAMDGEGRVITLEFDGFYLVAAYVVNAGEGLKRLDFKQDWDKAMLKYLKGLDASKGVLWCGDLNVAHKEIDLARPATNSKTAGFTKEEREGFERILNENTMIDVWRHQHPTLQQYTYYSYRFSCRTKRIGWRLDYFVASERLLSNLGECIIRDECYGASDHVPLVLQVESSLFEKEA